MAQPLWFTPAPAAPSAAPAAPPRHARPAADPAVLRRKGLEHDAHREIVAILAGSRRVSAGPDRHPLVRFERAGVVPTNAGVAQRVLVHSRYLLAHGRTANYDTFFLILPDGSVEETR